LRTAARDGRQNQKDCREQAGNGFRERHRSPVGEEISHLHEQQLKGD
jgi:hypothetical protein